MNTFLTLWCDFCCSSIWRQPHHGHGRGSGGPCFHCSRQLDRENLLQEAHSACTIHVQRYHLVKIDGKISWIGKVSKGYWWYVQFPLSKIPAASTALPIRGIWRGWHQGDLHLLAYQNGTRHKSNTNFYLYRRRFEATSSEKLNWPIECFSQNMPTYAKHPYLTIFSRHDIIGDRFVGGKINQIKVTNAVSRKNANVCKTSPL